MSFYPNGNHRQEEPSDSAEGNLSDTSSPSPGPFKIQASLIPNENKFQYKSARGLITIIQDILDLGSAGIAFSFLYFDGLTDSEFPIIEDQLELVQLRSAIRFTFENSLNAAIVRIMPGPEHEKVGISLYTKIVWKIASLPGHSDESVVGVGATRFNVPGVRSKEGDQGLHPATRRGRDAWPSLMIEVGYSEGLDLLHLDARWWLINSQGKTRFVIIVKIGRGPFAIHLECWRMAPTRTTGPQTRQRPAWSPDCIQQFDIDAAGSVTSPTSSPRLEIPYDCIFDQSSLHAPPIVFSHAELSHFALRMFQMLE